MTFKDYFIPENDSSEETIFKKMVSVSIALHIFAFVFFGLKAAIFPNESLTLDPVIKVDMVGLPDKVAQLPAPPAAAPAVPEPVKDEKTAPPKPELKAEPKKIELPKPKAPVVLHPDKNAQKKALDKIRALEKEERRHRALESIENEVAAEENKVQQQERQERVNKLLKGNAVSPGSALHGLTKSEFNEYMGQIHNEVQRHWNLPEWLQNDSLKASVVVFLDSRGVVLRRAVEKSSGDPRFDDLALRAVDESSPFPKPPEKFSDLVRVSGIVLGFPQ